MGSEVIKIFNLSLKEYLTFKTEESVNSLQRNLQVLSSSIDVDFFNPGNREAVEFYSNLYELMMTLDVNNNITWSSIEALQEACRNRSARESLTHSFKFVPILSKLLDNKLTIEKKVKILQLMQDLTYGIKISWQEAHLPHLISLLTKWTTGDEPKLIPLSLSILVNLCYNNSAAVYTLMKSVNVKSFLKALLKVQKSNTSSKVQVCKLLLILEGISGGVPDPEMETYIRSTCPTLKEAISMSNSSLMKHIIDFFKKIVNNERAKKIVNNYPNYAEDIEGLLNMVRDADEIDSECLAPLFDYFSCVIGLEISGLEGLYPHFLILALQWLREDAVSPEVLKLISNIVSDLFTKELNNIPAEKAEIMDAVHNLLDDHILMILSLLDVSSSRLVLGSNEVNLKLTALLHLLTLLVRIEKFSDKMIALLDQQVFRKLFDPLMSLECEENLFHEPVYTFYVEALCFVTDLSDKETSWLLLYNELLQEKQVQTILSIALYTGSEYIKKKVLTLTGTAGFLTECIGLLAKRMADLNKLVIFSPSNLTHHEQQINSSYISSVDMMPMLTITQEGHLNSVLEKCEQAAKRNESTLTSSIMELYQYKMAVMNQNLRQLQFSQEAADQRATRLQHNLLLTSSEVSRLHQLLFGSQQSLEIATKESNSLASQLSQVKQEAQETHNKYSEILQNLKSKTIIISQQNQELETYKSQLSSKEDRILNLEEQLQLKTQECSRLNNDLLGAKESISSMKKQITNLEAAVETSKKEVLQQSLVLNKLEKQINEKDKEIGELNKELSEQRRMREIISELAMGKRKLDK